MASAYISLVGTAPYTYAVVWTNTSARNSLMQRMAAVGYSTHIIESRPLTVRRCQLRLPPY